MDLSAMNSTDSNFSKQTLVTGHPSPSYHTRQFPLKLALSPGRRQSLLENLSPRAESNHARESCYRSPASGSGDPTDVDLGYELPPLVESLRKGWLNSMQSAGMLSALFAVLSILLLMFITDRGDLSSYLHSPAGTALSIFSYSAILLNGSAAVTALVMTDKVGGLSMKASRRSALSPEKGYISGDAKLLNRYGIGTAWSWVFGHWVICFHGGVLCLLIEILMYVWLKESATIKMVLLVIGSVSLLPMSLFFPLSLLF